MKRTIVIILALAALATVGVLGYLFYDQNLRGLKPAITPPSEDITETLNTTGMPLTLPPGMSVRIFAKDLGNARVMTYDPQGALLVSATAHGNIYALSDTDGNGSADQRVTVLENLRQPHGMVTTCQPSGEPPCVLYVAETDKVSVYDYDGTTKRATNKQELAGLPSGGGHSTRTIMIDPADPNQLLVSIGSTCNVCREEDQRRAAIWTLNLTTKEFVPFASGLRNSVFMAIHPVDGKVWATEMGRDLLGDDIPPDEVNVIEKGGNYGWPNCYGKNIHDDAFDKNVYIRNPCMSPFETPSQVDLQAHSAPLGLAFIPEEGWPEDWWFDLLVAYHGSWNRSEPTGYKIVRVKLNARGEYEGVEDFVTGWLRPDGTAIGRPVDILVQPGSKMYVSDDKAGVIYQFYRATE